LLEQRILNVAWEHAKPPRMAIEFAQGIEP
jgi:hypothetical protein